MEEIQLRSLGILGKIDELTQRVCQAEAASSGGEDSNRVPPAALRQLVWRCHSGATGLHKTISRLEQDGIHCLA